MGIKETVEDSIPFMDPISVAAIHFPQGLAVLKRHKLHPAEHRITDKDAERAAVGSYRFHT